MLERLAVREANSSIEAMGARRAVPLDIRQSLPSATTLEPFSRMVLVSGPSDFSNNVISKAGSFLTSPAPSHDSRLRSCHLHTH